MRKPLSALLCLALAAAALPPGAWAQAAVRLSAPRTAVPRVVIPGFSFAAPTAAPTFGAAPVSPSFIGTAPAPLRLTLPAASPVRAAAARAEAALVALPAAHAAVAPTEGARTTDDNGPARAPAIQAANDDAPPPALKTAAGRQTSGRVARRFAELRAAFGIRAREDFQAGAAAATARPVARLKTAAPSGAAAQAAPPAPAAKKARGLFGLAPVLVFFLAALAIENVGIEAQNLGLPPLIAKVFGDVTISAEMGIWASLADVVGSVLTPPLIKKLGLKKTFLWSGGVRLAFAALTAGLLAVGHITVPGLLALTALGALVGGINYTAEKAIPAVLLEQDRAGLERFKAARQGVIEVIATLIPIAAGALVSQLGFMPAVFAFPAAGVLAMILVGLTLRMPQRAAAALARLPEGAPAAVPAGVMDFLRALTRGTRLVWGRASLRTPFLAYAAFSILTHLFYWIIAPAYGILVAGAGREEAAALVQGVMLGLFSLGGLVASVYVMREHKRFDRLDPAQRDGAMRRSLKRWMVLGTVVLAAMVTMAVPLPAWGALTVPALALVPFGMAQVVAKLKLEALLQSAAPAEAVDDVTAAMEAWMSVAIMAGLWGVKAAFAAATGYGPFAILAWAMLPLAAACLLLTRLLARTPKSV